MALRAMHLIFSENNRSIRFSGNLHKQFPIKKAAPIPFLQIRKRNRAAAFLFLYTYISCTVTGRPPAFQQESGTHRLQHDFALHPGSIGHSRIGIGKLRLHFRSVEILKEPEVSFPLSAGRCDAVGQLSGKRAVHIVFPCQLCVKSPQEIRFRFAGQIICLAISVPFTGQRGKPCVIIGLIGCQHLRAGSGHHMGYLAQTACLIGFSPEINTVG